MELEHPTYRDAAGTVLRWRHVRQLARGTDGARRVRARRWGRTVLRVLFAGVTAVEVWGTWQLARQENYLALPLGAQAASTGLVATLLWTGAPQQRREDRALIVQSVNQKVRLTPGR